MGACIWLRTARIFSYRLVASSHEIILFMERGPREGISFSYEGETKTLKRKEELIIPTTLSAFPKAPDEKIHFGCSKKQDWLLVKRRQNIEEILPVWFELGKHVPPHPVLETGLSCFLAKCQEQIEAKENDKIGSTFLELFKIGFEGILSPHLVDQNFSSYLSSREDVPQEASPLVLLGEGARLIRALLIQAKEKGFSILPCLPKELHAGRFTQIHLRESLIADLEWSKKQIRRFVLHPKKDQEVCFTFQSSIHTFRLGWEGEDEGKPLKWGKPSVLKGTRFTFSIASKNKGLEGDGSSF